MPVGVRHRSQNETTYCLTGIAQNKETKNGKNLETRV